MTTHIIFQLTWIHLAFWYLTTSRDANTYSVYTSLFKGLNLIHCKLGDLETWPGNSFDWSVPITLGKNAWNFWNFCHFSLYHSTDRMYFTSYKNRIFQFETPYKKATIWSNCSLLSVLVCMYCPELETPHKQATKTAVTQNINEWINESMKMCKILFPVTKY